MYPNLYFVFNDWFGWKINAFKIFYTFGIFVALAFIVSAYFLTIELKTKRKARAFIATRRNHHNRKTCVIF